MANPPADDPALKGIVDTHVHFWDTKELSYPWLTDTPERGSYTPDDYCRVTDGRVSRVVVVEAGADAGSSLAEVRWIDSLAEAHPFISGVVAACDLTAISLSDTLLGALVGHARVVGVRHSLQDDPVNRWRIEELSLGIGAVTAHGLTVDVCVRHGQLDALAGLLEQTPDATVALDHLGKPPVDAGISSDAGQRWCANMKRLAQLPRLAVKLSGLAGASTAAPLFSAHADAFVDFAVQEFGAERSMIGSDWPVSANSGARVSVLPWASRIQRVVGPGWHQISSATAISFYGL
ncbi:L-fuconolactonase [Microbacterium sp. AK009]|uniref:amidohydrolase family protein n=1 Tax=Microbacterium sp. AK009 TaxID=2723068 RepID=UPI0015C82CF0|nr:amidohydrolase family protein [Microbacterium sp. AK009]NYF16605.1 L-fuconolactonase [Microbacterium sp. AK009]